MDALDVEIHSYGNQDLQKVAVYKHNSNTLSNLPKRWLIFIHGGAWRDPNNTYEDGNFLISSLLNSFPNVLSAASIKYRLTSNKPVSAIYPDFVEDLILSLDFLDKNYPIDEFILVGHSAGAFNALACLTPENNLLKAYSNVLSKCKSVIGIAGIYSLPLLLDEDKSYNGFIEEAFGMNHSAWPLLAEKLASSPLHKDVKLLIVYSKEDELLNYKYQPKYALETFPSILGQQNVTSGITEGQHEDTYKSPKTVEIITKFLNQLG